MVHSEKLLLRYHHHRSSDIFHVMLLVFGYHLRYDRLAFGTASVYSFLRRQPSGRIGSTDGWSYHRKRLQRNCK